MILILKRNQYRCDQVLAKMWFHLDRHRHGRGGLHRQMTWSSTHRSKPVLQWKIRTSVPNGITFFKPEPHASLLRQFKTKTRRLCKSFGI